MVAGYALGRAPLVSLPDDAPGMLGAVLRSIAEAGAARAGPQHVVTARVTWDAVEKSAGMYGSSSLEAFGSLFGLPVFIDDDVEPGRWDVRPGDRPEASS